MAFDDLEIKRNENALAQFLARRRPPTYIRDQVDIACKISGQSVEIVEVRADWKDPTRKIEAPVAKATFVQAKNHWNVYWMRGDLKWHAMSRTVKSRHSNPSSMSWIKINMPASSADVGARRAHSSTLCTLTPPASSPDIK